MQYNYEQKANIRKLRQAELDQLKKQIIELQIALSFHFNELIDSRNKAVKEFRNIEPEINKSINIWNATPFNNCYQIAVYQYENIHIKVEDILNNIENRNKELKFALEYYKNIKNASVLKRTTNINELIKQEEKEIGSVEKLLSAERDRNNCHQKIVEGYFFKIKANINNFKNNVTGKIKKQREAQIKKELTDARKQQGSIKPPKEPKKDNKQQKDNTKIKICEKNARHIFRIKKGHLPDTANNRKILLDLASDKNNFLGVDKWNCAWYSKILSNGKQVWARVRNNLIINGGINKDIRSFNPETGLCQLTPLVGKNICK